MIDLRIGIRIIINFICWPLSFSHLLTLSLYWQCKPNVDKLLERWFCLARLLHQSSRQFIHTKTQRTWLWTIRECWVMKTKWLVLCAKHTDRVLLNPTCVNEREPLRNTMGRKQRSILPTVGICGRHLSNYSLCGHLPSTSTTYYF